MCVYSSLVQAGRFMGGGAATAVLLRCLTIEVTGARTAPPMPDKGTTAGRRAGVQLTEGFGLTVAGAKGQMMTADTNTAAPMTVTLEQMAQAFEAWENGFRAEPSKYLTAEECAASNVSTLSADRAAYFRELLAVALV